MPCRGHKSSLRSVARKPTPRTPDSPAHGHTHYTITIIIIIVISSSSITHTHTHTHTHLPAMDVLDVVYFPYELPFLLRRICSCTSKISHTYPTYTLWGKFDVRECGSRKKNIIFSYSFSIFTSFHYITFEGNPVEKKKNCMPCNDSDDNYIDNDNNVF